MRERERERVRGGPKALFKKKQLDALPPEKKKKKKRQVKTLCNATAIISYIYNVISYFSLIGIYKFILSL